MEDQVRAVAQAVRDGLLAGYGTVGGMCYVAARDLAGRLRDLGLAARVAAGTYEGLDHQWVEVTIDGLVHVVDPTVDQFAEELGRRLPAVRLAPRAWHPAYEEADGDA